jgi:hypothetical protein
MYHNRYLMDDNAVVLTVGVSKVAAMTREGTCCPALYRLTRAFFGVL